MPLLILEKDLTWNETTDSIKIIIPIQSRVDSKISILTTSLYLKVSSPPWFWECFLAAPVHVSSSHAWIDHNQVSFELRKEVPFLWKKLEDENKTCKEFRTGRRDAAYEENKRRLEETEETIAAKKHEIHQASVRRQMHIDERERKMIDREKNLVNERVAAEIEKISKEQRRAEEISLKRRELKQISQDIPPTRKVGVITVSFTPRVFPTAARESQEPEENEWLKKQAAAAVCLEFDCKDLSPQEKNPEWLKGKAEFLFDKKDFRGALNAYSLAVRMCPSMYSLYLGRSKCHLELRNLHKCIEDSSKALELLQPPVPSNAKYRVESHKIRGTAFRRLDLPLEGLIDFDAALKIEPFNEALKTIVEELKHLVQTSED